MSKVMRKTATDINASVTAASCSSSPATKGIKRRNERNILTFYEKIAVIHYYNETNISRNSLAKMFHCCATQIRRILDKKHELLQQQATMSETDASIIIEEMTRKRRKFEMSAISFILHQWVERCRQLGLRKSITNQTLKETATKMAAILNLPAFRPSYRWLNRFRGKYKYNAPDLSAVNMLTPGVVEPDAQGLFGDLAVEDIIIEFKDSLPSFMQKEITTITSTIVKGASVGGVKAEVELENIDQPKKDYGKRLGGEWKELNKQRKRGEMERENDQPEQFEASKDEAAEVRVWQNNNWEACMDGNDASQPVTADSAKTAPKEHNEMKLNTNEGGTCALLSNIFPHLAVVHQFALLNSDVKALELISQLGVHMQTQALAGAYKDLSLATASIHPQQGELNPGAINGGIYADMDDIVLME